MFKKLMLSVALFASLIAFSELTEVKAYEKSEYKEFINQYLKVVENDDAKGIVKMTYISENTNELSLTSEISEYCLDPSKQVKKITLEDEGTKIDVGYKFTVLIEKENGTIYRNYLIVADTNQGLKIDRDYNTEVGTCIKDLDKVELRGPQPRARVATYDWWIERGRYSQTSAFSATGRVGVNYRQRALRGTYMLVQGDPASPYVRESKTINGTLDDKAYQLYFTNIGNGSNLRFRILSTETSSYWGEVYN